jgi:hypothetical protein
MSHSLPTSNHETGLLVFAESSIQGNEMKTRMLQY